MARIKIENGRFSLRLPPDVLEAIDAECAQRVGCISRNTWIAEAIFEKLAKDARSPLKNRANDDKAA